MSKVLVISELGINHNGNLNLAKEMIKASKESGADLIKLQKRNIDKVYSPEELAKPRESKWGNTTRDQKLGLEFNEEQYDEINRYCEEIGIEWFASAWDLESQLFLKKYDLSHNKIASAMLTHLQLLEMVAEERKPTMIATGMSTLAEIDKAVEIFTRMDCPFSLIHTNSTYPCADDKLNLNCIKTLGENYGCDVGYSCHSSGIIPAVLAVALGACSVEKHFTMDRTLPGSDQASSVEPGGFERMVQYIRLSEKSLGDGKKVVFPEEQPIKQKLRRTKDYNG